MTMVSGDDNVDIMESSSERSSGGDGMIFVVRGVWDVMLRGTVGCGGDADKREREERDWSDGVRGDGETYGCGKIKTLKLL